MGDHGKVETEYNKRLNIIVYIVLALLAAVVLYIGTKDTGHEELLYNAEIPPYSGAPYVVINDNTPFFEREQLELDTFTKYSDMDKFGRCGTAFGVIGSEYMPSEERKDISGVKPSGWNQAVYEGIVDDDPPCLWNRCHLFAFCLTGENANANNLITGTHYMNIQGMFEFEKIVAKYIRTFDNHVLYRVTPDFHGKERVARGVLMEGFSIEDNGEGVCFCVYCYNVQPGVEINYRNGDSKLSEINN